MEGEPVIPAPYADDDDDVAWALQTAAVQWQRGQRADAVVWLRRAVEASIEAGKAERTRELTRLAASVADRLVSEALAVPDSRAPPHAVQEHDSDVDELLARPSSAAPKSVRPRASSHSMGDIPVEFDAEDAELIDDDLEDDFDDDFVEDLDDRAPTLPPPDPVAGPGFRHELSSREYEYEDPSDSYIDKESGYDDGSTLTGQAVKRIPSYDDQEEGDTESVIDEELFSDRPGPLSHGAGSPGVRPGSPSARPGSPSRAPGGPSSRSGNAAGSQRAPSSSGRPPTSQNIRNSERAWGARPSDGVPSPSSRPPGSDRPIEPIVTAEELFRQKEIENAKKKESQPPAHPEKAPSVEVARPALPIVDDISLDAVRGFEDLPETAQRTLAQLALLTTLSTDEEVGSFGAALVTRGKVGIMPAIADVASSVAKAGEIVFTRGTLSEGVPLRVVALENQTNVASWSDETLQAVMADCPWVSDELRMVADRFQALAGAVLGPLGERLDDTLRELVVSRLEVRAFRPHEVIVVSGKPVPGLHVVGGGRVDLVLDDGKAEEASPGEFLFAAEVLGAGRAHATARAGKAGALILFAPRSVAHELLLSVPTLIEILAG